MTWYLNQSANQISLCHIVPQIEDYMDMCDTREMCKSMSKSAHYVYLVAEHDIFTMSQHSGFYEDNEHNDICVINVHCLTGICL